MKVKVKPDMSPGDEKAPSDWNVRVNRNSVPLKQFLRPSLVSIHSVVASHMTGTTRGPDWTVEEEQYTEN